MNRHRVFSTLIDNKKYSYTLILTSIVLALGINLFSTGIAELIGFKYKEIVFIVLGLILSICVIAVIINVKLNELNQTIKFDGFFIYDKDTHKLTKIPEYPISNDMVSYLNAAFIEDHTLSEFWNSEDLTKIYIIGGSPGERAIAFVSNSTALFVELLEYCVLERLSTHLTDYFNNEYIQPKIQKFEIADIPESILRNRFLKLFSNDISNRIGFGCHSIVETADDTESEIISAYSQLGAYYSKFTLTLPKNSVISRHNNNTIVIKTPILTITLTSLFGAFNTVLRSGFTKYYLGLPKKEEATKSTFQFNVEISIKFKLRSLFSKDKELYYSWIDSFLDKLSDYLDKDTFFNKINWSSAISVIHSLNNINNNNH